MKKGEIWLVELPSTNGHEQSGKRPALILSETAANIVIVVPLTSNLQALRFPDTIEVKPSKQNGLATLSVALVFHIRAIDKKRLKSKIGNLEDSSLKEVEKTIRKILQL
ncbi:type II toxin-antitoxin system PemK/MazF family toxin [Candidatus Woesearchaeota archaeon]|nr:type II toxin-antitoxin system PemK/MazF family toxin [Candidatus Woesearchaeota archaeon]